MRRLFFFSLLLTSVARADLVDSCVINRSVDFCNGAKGDCSESAEKDMRRYSASHVRCGAQREAAPSIMRAQGEPKGTVVLVHGLSANPAHMAHTADRLSKDGYNVVMPLLHGHGGTDELLGKATLDQWKADVRFAGSVGEKMQKPLYIMGHSTGGVMAALEASLHPGKYKAIIGMDPALNVQGEKGPSVEQACLAKNIGLTFPSNLPRMLGGKPASDPEGCHENKIAERAKELKEIMHSYCEKAMNLKVQMPPTNLEFTTQSLCALSRATKEMTADRMKKLPPALMFLSKDDAIFGYISKDKLKDAVAAKKENLTVDSKSQVHGLMHTACSPSFGQDMTRVRAWLQSHQ